MPSSGVSGLTFGDGACKCSVHTHNQGPAGILRLQHPPIITRTMPALAAAVANVNGPTQYAGTVAAVLLAAQINLKL